jgi:nucleoside-diphosphate-sugar epimerase
MIRLAPLVVLGCGFTGTVAAGARRASGGRVIATTRSAARAAELARRGVEAHVAPALPSAEVERLVPDGADVLVAFPPDGATDAAIAPALDRARAIVYLSSTAVYGGATGLVDESTPVDPGDRRAAARLAAEAEHLRRGAVVLRAAGIYGPGRGLHLRLLRGEHRLVDGGRTVVSRVHVEDLARLALAALDRPLRGQVFTVADDAPVPQIEVVTWLCHRLHLPLPPAARPDEVHDTLRHDRAVSNAAIKRALGLELLYPTYREGFEACFADEKSARGD